MLAPGWSVEDKFTRNAKSITLKLSDLHKIEGEATSRLENPALVVGFEGAAVRPGHSNHWAVVPYEVWLDLVAAQAKEEPEDE